TRRPSGLAMAFAMVFGITIIDALVARRLSKQKESAFESARGSYRRRR
ncbi:MAG: hypothetical protein JWN51_2175, partial [Phycisphaerales bacterium]|nr:hypothetical protein [Phycisphaerales bacterium]